MVNKSGGKVRLSFKMENDQLQIGTKERTEKISMSSIKNVVNEPIEGHEEYHILVWTITFLQKLCVRHPLFIVNDFLIREFN